MDLSKEIEFQTSRSGGKGGQNVNKVGKRVTRTSVNKPIEELSIATVDPSARGKERKAFPGWLYAVLFLVFDFLAIAILQRGVTLSSTKVLNLVTTTGNGGVLINAIGIVQDGEVTPYLNTYARARLVPAVANGGQVAASLGATETDAGRYIAPEADPVDMGLSLEVRETETATTAETSEALTLGIALTLTETSTAL